MSVLKQEFFYDAANGEGKLHAQCWVPPRPKAIVQIAHGMSEYADRYDEFATMLAQNGYAVYANDHTGHGKSAQGHPGTFALKKGGFECVLADMGRLFDRACAEHPGLPLVLMGHSMGSVLSGIFADRYGGRLSALILMGTPAPNKMTGMGIALASLVVAFCGYTRESKWLNKLTADAITKDNEASKQWLSYNQENVQRYLADPLCGIPFSASANRELFYGMREFGADGWGQNIPEIPILVIAGADDPAGKCGEGPKHYFSQLKRSGHADAALTLVEHARHEILNENNADETMRLLLDWLETRFAQKAGQKAG